MKNIKKRNHYITKYYLKEFTDKNGIIWMYKKCDPTHPTCSQPNKVAVDNTLYHLENGENSINAIEDYFSDKVEGPASIAFKQLTEKKFPSDSDREKLSLLFGMQMVRTPLYINHLNKEQSEELNIIAKASASNKNNFYSDYKKVNTNLNEAEIEKDRQAILAGDFSFELHRDILLIKMIPLGAVISSLLCNMKWALIETDDDYPFITSDNMINISHPTIPANAFYQPGLGMRDTRITIPISNRLTLFMVNDDDFQDSLVYSVDNPICQKSGNKINLKEIIKNLNKRTYLWSNKYVFANSDSKKLKTCFNNLLQQAKFLEKNKIEKPLEKDSTDYEMQNN